MGEITVKCAVREIEELASFSNYFIYHPGQEDSPLEKETFEDLSRKIPSWNAQAMATGIRRLRDLTLKGQVVYRVYPEEEWADDPQKQDVLIFAFLADPEVRKKNAPFIIMTAGGSYESVCSMVEAFPTAASFNDLGYHVFVLNYRVGGRKVMPKPLEDVAAAYRYLCDHRKQFALETEEYVVCGFSAGGNLAGLWGTQSQGYAYYGLKKPETLFLVYPAVRCEYLGEGIRETFCTTMLGEACSREYEMAYDIPHIFTEDYPPCYIIHCKDDSTVLVKNALCLKQLLEENRIPAHLELGEKGEHGFGNGKGSDVEGWPGRAVAFLENLYKD